MRNITVNNTHEALLGIDLGTTGLKAVIYKDGKALGKGYLTYPISTPQSGFAEQNPDEWGKIMAYSIRQALLEAKLDPSEIKAVGFSGQMHGTVMLNEAGLPVYPAIIWCDTRSGEQCVYINEKIGKEHFYGITQNNVSCGFQAPSLLWIKQNRPEIFSRIKYVLSPKDYLRKLLCGNIGCDITDASATLLYDNINNEWSDDIIRVLGFEGISFPKTAYPYEIAGYINKDGVQLTSLCENTPVVFGGGDQPMQAVANGIIEDGRLSLTVGTGGQLFYASDVKKARNNSAVSSFLHANPNMKYFLAATLGACLSINWFCEKVIGDVNYKALDKNASEIPPGSGGVVFLPHLTGERTPYMNPDARGVFWGLSLNTDKSYLYKAVMEGVAYSIRDALEELAAQTVVPNEILASGGAFKSSVWAQIFADVLNRPLHIASLTEPSAAGAAICAGVGCGIFTSLKEGFESFNRNNLYTIYTPDSCNADIYNHKFKEYKEVYMQTCTVKHAQI